MKLNFPGTQPVSRKGNGFHLEVILFPPPPPLFRTVQKPTGPTGQHYLYLFLSLEARGTPGGPQKKSFCFLLFLGATWSTNSCSWRGRVSTISWKFKETQIPFWLPPRPFPLFSFQFPHPHPHSPSPFFFVFFLPLKKRPNSWFMSYGGILVQAGASKNCNHTNLCQNRTNTCLVLYSFPGTW